MSNSPITIQNVGLVTSIGLSTAATCAALRASITNPTETRFMDSDGNWILAHQVELDKPWRGRTKLVKMAALAITESIEHLPIKAREGLPLLLCVAERERPGRAEGLDDLIFSEVQAELGIKFHPKYSAVIPMGRPAAFLALATARKLIHEDGLRHVLIAATDSLVSWQTLMAYGGQGRLLAETNSNGFMPGEGAGALLVGKSKQQLDELVCLGIGNGIEPTPVMSIEPFRAVGLTTAIKHALSDAGCEMHDLDFRITDISGEQYFFKEAALALTRTLRKRKDEFDLWHPAEGIGEAGATVGPMMIANALIACQKSYAKGERILLHSGSDGDLRVAAIVHWSGAIQ